MKVSIITICKNEVDTIEDTILSVINQTHQDIEYIVVDSVSTDGTLDVIEKYRDKISKVISEPDSGIYNAMNKGIRLATGELLNFMNANDTFFDNKVIESVVRAFKNNPESMLSFSDAYYVNKNILKNQVFNYTQIYNIPELFLESNLAHQSMFYKKELFEKYGLYNENYVIDGDTERNMCFLLKQKVKAIYIPFVAVNYLMGGLSSNIKMKEILEKERKRNCNKYYFHNRFNQLSYNITKLGRYFYPKSFLDLNKKVKIKEMMNVKMVEVS